MEWIITAIVFVFLFFLPVVVVAIIEELVTSKLQRREKYIAVVLAVLLGSFGLHWSYLCPFKSRVGCEASKDDFPGLPSFYISEFLLFFVVMFSLLPGSGIMVGLLLFCFLIMVLLGIRDAVWLYNMSDEAFDRCYNKGGFAGGSCNKDVVEECDNVSSEFDDAVRFFTERDNSKSK